MASARSISRATLKRLSPSDGGDVALALAVEVVAPGDGRREHERGGPGALLQCHGRGILTTIGVAGHPFMCR